MVIPMHTHNTVVWVYHILWSAKVQYHTWTHSTCFGKIMAIPVPIPNPNQKVSPECYGMYHTNTCLWHMSGSFQLWKGKHGCPMLITSVRPTCLDWIAITATNKFCAQVTCMIPSWLSSASQCQVPSFNSMMPSLSLVYWTVNEWDQGS